MIEVFKVGTTVNIGGATALITGIMIRGTDHQHVIYECVWWNGYDRKECWVQAHEIDPVETTQTQIGFKS